MSNDPSNPELPDGKDPTALPAPQRDEGASPRAYRDHGKRAFAQIKTLAGASPSVPQIYTQDQNPINVLTKLFDLNVAASAILEEEFQFKELYTTYIDLFRNDPDPKIRMGAGDRLYKLVKDALIAGGAITKTVDEMQIRSPDGTLAKRSVINRSIIRSFEEDTTNASRSQEALTPPQPGLAQVLQDIDPAPSPTVDDPAA